jgi:hypothetical protein
VIAAATLALLFPRTNLTLRNHDVGINQLDAKRWRRVADAEAFWIYITSAIPEEGLTVADVRRTLDAIADATPPTVVRRRGPENAAHQRALLAWAESGTAPADPDVFRQRIWPSLRSATNAQVQAATGLSEHYCSLIRLGKRVPHERHWPAPLQSSSGHATAGSSSARHRDLDDR